MPNDNLKSYLHLHLIVFIWGFTAILGKLISLQALQLVWYRMAFAVIIMAFVVYFKKQKEQLSWQVQVGFIVAGFVITLHWITFYQAIKVSNISITLACLSTGAFFASILEPIFEKRKIVPYEVFFGFLVIIGLGIIFRVETQYIHGIYLSITSAFLSALFSVINSKYAKLYHPNTISFYELFYGVVLLSIYFLWNHKFTPSFFKLSQEDLLWLVLLASICTAYAFSASVKVMKFLSPFTVMLTINLEPIYGIVLAILIFSDTEFMSNQFYLGATIILLTVVANGLVKNLKRYKKSI